MSSPAPQLDPVPLVEALGLRLDTPRAVVKSIVTTVDSMGATDAAAVELVLSTFDLRTLLKPGASVGTLASGIAELARSDAWASVVEMSK